MCHNLWKLEKYMWTITFFYVRLKIAWNKGCFQSYDVLTCKLSLKKIDAV